MASPSSSASAPPAPARPQSPPSLWLDKADARGQSDPLPDGADAARIARLKDAFDTEVYDEASAAVPAGGTTLGPRLYGEVAFETIAAVLEIIRLRHGGLPAPGAGVFVDAGSGAGRAVLAAASLHPWRRCIGVEIAPELVGVAEATAARWCRSSLARTEPPGPDRPAAETVAAPDIAAADVDATAAAGQPSAAAPPITQPPREIVIAEGDALEAHWYAGADVVFACWIAWPEPMRRRLVDVALAEAPSGSFLVTTGIRALSSSWRLVDRSYRRCSWGATPLLVHRREADLPRWRTLHAPQLVARGVPERLWALLADAFVRRDFRAGEKLQLAWVGADVVETAVRRGRGGGGGGGVSEVRDVTGRAEGDCSESNGSMRGLSGSGVGLRRQVPDSGGGSIKDSHVGIEEGGGLPGKDGIAAEGGPEEDGDGGEEEQEEEEEEEEEEDSALLLMAREPLGAFNDVFLIDHAWTFRSLADARACLAMPELAARIRSLVSGGGGHGGSCAENSEGDGARSSTPRGSGSYDAAGGCGGEGAGGGGSAVPGGESSAEEELLSAVARRAGWYAVAGSGGGGASSTEPSSFFFLMDEVGSCMATAVESAEGAENFRVVPVFCMDEQECFSVAWPIRDVAAGDAIVVAVDAAERRHVAELLRGGGGSAGGGGGGGDGNGGGGGGSGEMAGSGAWVNLELLDYAAKAELQKLAAGAAHLDKESAEVA